MVAFRKLFPVLAIVALLLGLTTAASAQTTPLACTANAGVPPIVRAEGLTELTGDLVLVCTGGNSGQTFLANFQLFLNTNITSRITNNLSEATLLIDEPGVPRIEAPGTSTPFCLSPAATSNSVTNLTDATCVGSSAGTSPAATYQRGTYTVFRAQKAAQGENAVVWAGVPVTPPGTNGTRTFRITNVRANAAGLGTSNTLIPTQIVGFISVSASQSLAINNPQQTVAYIQSGLQFDLRNCQNTDAPASGTVNTGQCTSQNSGLFTDPNAAGPFSTNLFGIRFREGFQTAFKRRIETAQANPIAGAAYNTESGYVLPDGGGLANSATRLVARFSNVPAGTRIFVSTSEVTSASSGGLDAVLVTADPSGAGNIASSGTAPIQLAGSTSLSCSAVSTAAVPAAEVLMASGSGVAVWEITAADAASIDTAFFYIGVAYTSNTANNLPGLGTATVTGNFAPFYAANTANTAINNSSLPIPRFVDNPISRTAFTISSCQTNLLFPFVTNQAGFDTGIAISNTSRDPFSNNSGRLQGGRCTLNYYGGTTGGGAAPAAQTTNANVEAGSQLTFVLSSGGGLGVAGTPGFQGYMIASCNFRYAHGFAFITDGPIGQAQVAEGYVALVMDSGIDTRTGNASEVLGH